MARTITINADEALQDALSKRAAHERKSIAEVARDILEKALGDRSPNAPFAPERGPRLFGERLSAWQRALRTRKSP